MIPQQYAWLSQETGPKMLIEALKLYGVTEKAGAENNQTILDWANELSIHDYNADSIPWCGLFIATVAKRAGKNWPNQPLWARNWLGWGTKSPKPELGDVLVFSRESSGHVGLYIGEDATCYHVLAGNQSDAVNIKRIDKNRLLGARREYKIGVPENVRTIALSDQGQPSTNEA